jgi:hypothetical protein
MPLYMFLEDNLGDYHEDQLTYIISGSDHSINHPIYAVDVDL